MRYIYVPVSCALAGLAVIGVFVYIPGASNYAFWIMAAGYIILGLNYINVRAKSNIGVILAGLSVVAAFISVVAVFIYIPFISDYAFWFMVLAYIVLGVSQLLALE